MFFPVTSDTVFVYSRDHLWVKVLLNVKKKLHNKVPLIIDVTQSHDSDISPTSLTINGTFCTPKMIILLTKKGKGNRSRANENVGNKP